MLPPKKRIMTRLMMVLPLAVAFSSAPSAVKFDPYTAVVSIEMAHAVAKDGSGPGSNGPGSEGSGSVDGGDSGSDSNGGSGEHHDGVQDHKTDVHSGKTVVFYSDGYSEEITHGILKLKDPDGSIVIERPATAADFARLKVARRP